MVCGTIFHFELMLVRSSRGDASMDCVVLEAIICSISIRGDNEGSARGGSDMQVLVLT